MSTRRLISEITCHENYGIQCSVQVDQSCEQNNGKGLIEWKAEPTLNCPRNKLQSIYKEKTLPDSATYTSYKFHELVPGVNYIISANIIEQDVSQGKVTSYFTKFEDSM